MEDTSKQEILEAISLLADQVQDVSAELTIVKSQMVTKDYLDRKLFELRGDLILLSRQTNTKLSVLIEKLVQEKSLKRETADLILAMEPVSRLQ